MRNPKPILAFILFAFSLITFNAQAHSPTSNSFSTWFQNQDPAIKKLIAGVLQHTTSKAIIAVAAMGFGVATAYFTAKKTKSAFKITCEDCTVYGMPILQDGETITFKNCVVHLEPQSMVSA